MIIISGSFSDNINIYDKNLFDNYFHWDIEKKSKKGLLYFEHNVTVSTCNQYIKEIKSNRILETESNRMVQFDYLICLPAHEFQNPNNKIRYFKNSDIDYSKFILSYLDLNKIHSSLYQLIRYQEKTKKIVLLKELLGSPKKKTNTKLIFVDDTGWEYTFNILAVQQSNNHDTIYFTFEDKAKESSYIGNTLIKLVIYKNKTIEIIEM